MSGSEVPRGYMVGVTCPAGIIWEEMSRENVRIPMQDYNSLCVLVTVWVTLVNTQTHIQTKHLTGLYY